MYGERGVKLLVSEYVWGERGKVVGECVCIGRERER